MPSIQTPARLEREATKPQVLIQPFDFSTSRPELQKTSGKPTPSTIRSLRKNPTVALARSLVVAPVIMSNWTFKEDSQKAPEGARDKIREAILPHRRTLLKQGFQGAMDFGYAPFEKVFGIDFEGFQVIAKFKSLLQDFTTILVDKKGRFRGLRNEVDGVETDLTFNKSLNLNIDVEGTDWYGLSVMEIVESIYNMWTDVNKANDRFDGKIAGAHWVVHYPEGETIVNGTEKANDLIAIDILDSLQASGKIAVPNRVKDEVEELNAKDAPRSWKIELITAGGNVHTTFLDRLRYLDALIIRAFGFPERSVLEGQFGTKAEAEVHADLGVLNIEVKHQTMVEQINWHVVNQLLRMNYGTQAEGTVWIEPAPIIDSRLSLLKEILSRFLQVGDVAPEIAKRVGVNALLEEIGLPLIEDTDEEPIEVRERQVVTQFPPGQDDEETDEEPEESEDE